MGLFNKKIPSVDYDAIDAEKIMSNLLVMTESKERQAAIKKVKAGDLVTFQKTRKQGNAIYVVSALKSGAVLGEISYGTSEYLDKNFKNYRMLGKVTEIGRITPNCRGNEVRIEYKVYK